MSCISIERICQRKKEYRRILQICLYDAMMLSEMTDLVNEKEPRGTTTLEIGDDDELEVNVEIAELS